MPEHPVSVRHFDSYAILTLEMPRKRNPISVEMREALIGALAPLQSDNQIRSVIITGSGSTFCSGMDLNALKDAGSVSYEAHLADSQSLLFFLEYIYAFPKPTLAAVNGAAVAGGCGLAMACDLTLASTESYFSFSEVKIGFVPAIVSVYLNRLIGHKAARDLLLTGRKVSADEARGLGLVNEVVTSAALMQRATEVCGEIARNSPMAVQSTKKMLVQSGRSGLEADLKLAVKINAKARLTPDCREGVHAFLEKRLPKWTS